MVVMGVGVVAILTRAARLLAGAMIPATPCVLRPISYNFSPMRRFRVRKRPLVPDHAYRLAESMLLPNDSALARIFASVLPSMSSWASSSIDTISSTS